MRRATVVSWLAIAGAVVLVVGLVTAWADSALFNSSRFTRTALGAAQKDEVRSELVHTLVTRLIDDDSSLAGARGELEQTLNQIARGRPFRQLLTSAVLEVHYTVFNSDEPSLALNVTQVIDLLAAALREIDPRAAETVERHREAGVLRIFDRGVEVRLTALAEDVRFLASLLPSLGVAACVTAVALSRDRRATLIVIGVASAATALLARLALEVARHDVIARYGSAISQKATAAVWDTYAHDLIVTLWVICFTGAALALLSATAPRWRPYLAHAFQRRATTRTQDAADPLPPA